MSIELLVKSKRTKSKSIRQSFCINHLQETSFLDLSRHQSSTELLSSSKNLQVPSISGSKHHPNLDIVVPQGHLTTAEEVKEVHQINGYRRHLSELRGYTKEIQISSLPPTCCIKAIPLASPVRLLVMIRWVHKFILSS